MPKGPQGQKRPADSIARAVMVGQIATGEIIETPSAPKGAAGGRARAGMLRPEERSKIASLAAKKRWREKGAVTMQTPDNKTVARGNEAVCMYPNNSLKDQKKNLSDAFSGFSMLRERFKK